MTEVELMLSQAATAETDFWNYDADAGCLSCVRSTDLKFCYDSISGSGKCCEMTDLDSAGCNQM